MKKKITILGSTGSIGKTFINIVRQDKNNFDILLLTANKNIKQLMLQINEFNVKNIIVTDYKKYLYLKKILKKKKINIYNNFLSLKKIFKNKKNDYTMSAISGLDGLYPTLEILNFTKKIGIANKESIICGWHLIKKKLIKKKVKFIPIDSEHFSIWSLLNNTKKKFIEKVYITASGGPFAKYPIEKFKYITPKLALNHPSWKMGNKITIDSSTMMNKVFEIIEAKKIFDLHYSQLKILVHPKSYVHAVIKFKNGLTKILAHDTDMKIPIFNSIYSNNEKNIKTKKIDFKIINNLNFSLIKKDRFPVIRILDILPTNDSLFETVIVSANDKLVELFLEGKIKYLDISKVLLKITIKDEFLKFKRIKPKNIQEIINLNEYVRLKIESFCV